MPRPAKRKLARITSPSGWAPRVDQGPGRFFSPAQHFGLSLRGESVCVFRDWLSIFAWSQPKLSADYADWRRFGKGKLSSGQHRPLASRIRRLAECIRDFL